MFSNCQQCAGIFIISKNSIEKLMRASTETPNTAEDTQLKTFCNNQFYYQNKMQKSTLQPSYEEQNKEQFLFNGQSVIKQNPMESSSIVKVSQINPNAFSKIRLRQKSDSNIYDLKKEESKKFKAAIALEVMIKFEGSVRDGPYMMSMDFQKAKKKPKKQSSRKEEVLQPTIQGVYRNSLGMEMLEISEQPQQLSLEQTLSLKDTTMEQAKKYNYVQVFYDLTHNKQIKEKKQLNFNQLKLIKTIDLSLYQNLEILHLSKNQLTQIGFLGQLPVLKLLNMSGNQIKIMENLQRYRTLKELNLERNEIHHIEGLQQLEELEVLRLGFNKIRVIQNVTHLKKLKTLILTENKIKLIDNLNDLEQLQMLDLSGNQISQIQNLDGLFELNWLGLAGNKITKIENLYILKGPAFLDISGNPYKIYSNNHFIKALTSRNVTVKT